MIGRTVIGGAELPVQRFASIPPNTQATGDIVSMALLAGQSVGLVDEVRPAADIVRKTIIDAESVIRQLRSFVSH
jgi:enoyl-[acyl-carrier protein] reductase II